MTTCAYCGVGCSFKAEMRGEEVVRMVPLQGRQANHGHSCVKGRFAWGYATHPDRASKPMVRAKNHRPMEGSFMEDGSPIRPRVPAHSGGTWRGLDRRHQLFALHQ